jgi:predicted nuclease with TOPRIM domain
MEHLKAAQNTIKHLEIVNAHLCKRVTLHEQANNLLTEHKEELEELLKAKTKTIMDLEDGKAGNEELPETIETLRGENLALRERVAMGGDTILDLGREKLNIEMELATLLKRSEMQEQHIEAQKPFASDFNAPNTDYGETLQPTEAQQPAHSHVEKKVSQLASVLSS